MPREAAHNLPEVPADEGSAGTDEADSGFLPLPPGATGKPKRSPVPSDKLIAHYALRREKFVRAMVSGSLAACFALFDDLMFRRLKGKDLLDAIRLIEKTWGLPKFTKDELATAKKEGNWYAMLKHRGWDVDGMLKMLKDLPHADG